MSQKKRPSIQDVLRQRQQGEFVGRKDVLAAFQSHLARPWDDAERVFLFNFYGQGGVGKTTLLKRLHRLAEQAVTLAAWTDDTQADIPAVMARLAEDLKTQQTTFKSFWEQYNLYRSKQHELEADPDTPQGFAAFVSEKAARMAVYAGRRVPVAGVLFDMMDEEAVSEQAGRWATYVTRKLKNKREVDLVLDPVATLTPIFLDELYQLAENRSVILFFDTYERTAVFLDRWLRGLLDGQYGVLPVTVTIVIAGRDELDRDNWLSYEPILSRQSVEPFSKEEARDFLALKGITNEAVVEAILHLSGRFPLLLATLASESPDDPSQIDLSSTTAVERFLKWVPEPTRRMAALHGALPQFLNRDVLAIVISTHDTQNLFNWLREMPFVQEKGDSWVYHEVVRTQMLRHKRRESPQGWAKLHQKLAEYFAENRDALKLDVSEGQRDPAWQHFELQFRYHQLCQSPQENFSDALNQFLNALKANYDFAERWAATVEQAGKDTGNAVVTIWGEQLTTGLRAYRENQYEHTVGMFRRILEYPPLDPQPKAIALGWLGQIHRLQGDFQESLTALNEAIKIYPTYAYAIGLRGETYRVMKQLNEAIHEFSQALELDPQIGWVWRGRGQCYRLLKAFDQAINDFEEALVLEPGNVWTLAQRGVTYLWMGKHEKGLADLNRALEIDPGYAWVLSNRGDFYSSRGDYEKALADISRAITIEPKNASYVTRRGMLFRRQGDFAAAMKDFNLAIQLSPDYVFALGQRGDLYYRMLKFDEAVVDLTTAVEVEPTLDWAFVVRGKVLDIQQKHKEAVADFNEALRQNPNNAEALARCGIAYCLTGQLELALQYFDRLYDLAITQSVPRALLQMTLDDLDKHLALFPDHEKVQAVRGKLHSYLYVTV